MPKQRKGPELVNLYLVKIGDTVIYKIGFSTNHPNTRLRDIRKQSCNDVTLIHHIVCEQKYEKILHSLLHKRFIKFDNHREYFYILNYELESILTIFKIIEHHG